MNRFFSVAGFLMGVGFFSCNQGGGDDKAAKEMEEYSGGVFAAYMEFRPVHDKFMDSLVAETKAMLEERALPVDTNSLRVLLNNARAAREEALDLIKGMKEVDSAIGLKDTLVAYLQSAKHFYDSDYDKLISLTVTPRRSDSLATLHYVRTGIHALLEGRKGWLRTYQAFKEKYGIDTYAPVTGGTPGGVGAGGSGGATPVGAGDEDLGGVGSGRVDSVTVRYGKKGVALRLPYTRVVAFDSGKDYFVKGIYKGDTIGFELLMKTTGSAVIRFVSIGEPSDRFLWVLQTIFKLEVDKISHFADTVKADCISMGDYVDSLKKGGQGNYVKGAEYKLFFEPKDRTWEAECFLNINPSGHWIELVEIEAEYRAKLVRDMSRRK